MKYLYKRKDVITHKEEMVESNVLLYDDTLLKIRNIIIDKCGIRKPVEEVLTEPLEQSPLIRDYKEELIHTTSGDEYHVQYTKIEEPKLAKLIAVLLGISKYPGVEKTKLLDYLYGGEKFEIETYDVLAKLEAQKSCIIDETKKELNETIVNTARIHTLADELYETQRIINLNKDVDPSLQPSYLPSIKEATTIATIDSVDYETFQKVHHMIVDKY